jgi:proteasome lid subunit RPN8/RPN11
MSIEMRQQDVDRIHKHATECYPSECCGFLLGLETNGRRVVHDVAIIQNSWQTAEHNPYEIRPEDSTRNRSLVDPRDYLRIDREARQRGLDIISFYHSHPDHPSRPSEFDRRHAVPFLIYVILAVDKGVPGEMTAWLLEDDGARFHSEPLRIT